MSSPDPITIVSMLAGFPSAWRARAWGVPIALVGWRAMVDFCARTVLQARGVNVNRRWAAYGMAGLLASGRILSVRAEDVVPPVVDAADTGAGQKPLWEAGIGGFAGAVADYP